MCHYAHLTPFEREKILFFLAEGNSITEIAHLMKRKNIVASSSYRPPSKSVLPVQRTVPSVATGKRILWWASKERHGPFTGVLPEGQRHHRYARGLHPTEVP